MMSTIIKDQKENVKIIDMSHGIKVTDQNLDQDQESAIVMAIEEGIQKIERNQDQKEKQHLNEGHIEDIVKEREILTG